MQLSKNFHLSEFLVSQTAARNGVDMTPSPDVHSNLKRLANTILQPIRDELGILRVSSGYRPLELNRLIGGAKSSAHITGRAADFTIKDYSPGRAYVEIIGMGLPFDKIILEFNKWIHIQIAKPGSIPRGQLLRADRIDGKTRYSLYT